MAGLTLEQCEAKLALWVEAADAIAQNQSYSIDGRSLTRASLAEVREMIVFYNNMCRDLGRASGGPTITYAVAE